MCLSILGNSGDEGEVRRVGSGIPHPSNKPMEAEPLGEENLMFKNHQQLDSRELVHTVLLSMNPFSEMS